MSSQSKMYDRDGNLLPEGSILPDGGRMVIGTLMMDSAAGNPSLIGHRPGGLDVGDGVQRQLADVAREVRRDLRKEKLSDAWRNPPAIETKAPVKDARVPVQPTADAIEAMHDRRNARLESAYKGA